MNDRLASPQRVAVLLDGDLVPTARLAAQLEGAVAIAADGGMRHAQTLGLEPVLWVGDFDSAPAELRARNNHVPRRDHPWRKSISDGELAIEHALESGARELILCGALGGTRSDHMLFHILYADALARRTGTAIILTSGIEEARPILPGQTLAPGLPAGTVFSIIPLTTLTGLTISGADWPLDGVEVAQGSSLTLSNIARQNMAVTLGSGTAAMLATLAV
ncbi:MULTISPECIES: thiamine diphosphokinase [unclassified Roseitalea]|uniref:thiamine diphosphokinase n=1 Tax=unclassified Roseitalea TaxID=2639107 RepID=UPI00273F14DC|nr:MULTISPECIES: thiamine diphosphokinase [unclassified Roseitalea]